MHVLQVLVHAVMAEPRPTPDVGALHLIFEALAI